MSHVLHVTCYNCHCHKNKVVKNVTIDPMCYIFFRKLMQNPVQWLCKNITCLMSQKSVTKDRQPTTMPDRQENLGQELRSVQHCINPCLI